MYRKLVKLACLVAFVATFCAPAFGIEHAPPEVISHERALFKDYSDCAIYHANKYAQTSAPPSEVVTAIRSKCEDQRIALHAAIQAEASRTGQGEYESRNTADRVIQKLDKEFDPEIVAGVLDARLSPNTPVSKGGPPMKAGVMGPSAVPLVSDSHNLIVAGLSIFKAAVAKATAASNDARTTGNEDRAAADKVYEDVYLKSLLDGVATAYPNLSAEERKKIVDMIDSAGQLSDTARAPADVEAILRGRALSAAEAAENESFGDQAFEFSFSHSLQRDKASQSH